MFCKSVKISVAVLFLSAGICLAQERAPREKRQRESRLPRLNEMGIQNADGFFDRVKDELHLTDSQQAEFKKNLDAYKNELQSFRDEQKKQSDEGKEFADIGKQMEEARKAKDQARIQQLVDQMKAAREKRDAQEAPIRTGIEQATTKLHDKLAGRLGEKQKKDFEPLWQDAIAGRNSPLARINPRQLKELVMKLPKLTDDQKKKIEEVFKASEKDSSEGQRSADRRRSTEKVYDGVVAILTPEQKEKLLAEMGDRTKNRGGNRQTKAESKGG